MLDASTGIPPRSFAMLSYTLPSRHIPGLLSELPIRRSLHREHDVEETLPHPLSSVELLSGRWTLPVLAALRDGPIRLGQLHRRLPTASKKVLTETLRRLEQGNLLIRRDLSGRIRHVEYHLAPAMRCDVCRLLDELDRWTHACTRNLAQPASLSCQDA